MNKVIGLLAVGSLGFAMASNACVVKADDSERFRDPIPQSADVGMGVPGSATGATKTQGKVLHLSNSPAGSGGAGGGGASYAEYYQVTRDVTDTIDYGTAWVIGLVWTIVHTPATTVTAHSAVWGPGQGDALSPVVWRFTVNEVGDREYNYVLEGRPKGAVSEGDFKAVLTGHGFGRGRAEHREGSFTLDFDASSRLDPARSHDSGTISIGFDLRQYPATLHADLSNTVGANQKTGKIDVTHQADGSGSVDITLHETANPSQGDKADDLALRSRWAATGAGRGDAKFSGGALPSTVPSVQASECWDTSFARVYYKDSVDYKPAAGSAAACAFAQSAL